MLGYEKGLSDTKTFLIVILICLFTSISWFFVESLTSAQELDVVNQVVESVVDEKVTLLLAKAFIAEAGWDGANDHAAMAHILQRKATHRGISFTAQTRAYVALFRNKITADKRWKIELNFAGNKPRHWPSNLSWDNHRDRWFEAIERAREFQRGNLEDTCPGAKDWGMPGVDLPQGRQVKMRCKKHVKNDYYRYSKKIL